MKKLKYERPVIRSINVGMPNKAGFRVQQPITEVDGVEVKNLLKDYGSPLYVISEQTLEDTFMEAKRAFTTRYPKVQFSWSYKTNYLDSVCRLYHKLGSWAEVVSGFEYQKALQNGVEGSKIIFNGPDKSRDDLILAIKNSSYIHIDNFDELYEIIDISKTSDKRPKVAIRVNMDTGIQPQWDRFGFNFESGEAKEALNRIMLSGTLELAGLHCHIGTYIMSPSPYGVAAAKLLDLAYYVETRYHHSIKYIDLGGGFASKNTLRGAYLSGADTCPTFDNYADVISSALINSYLNPQNMPTLILETGRALIDDAGTLLGTVLANKRLADGRRSTIVDFGINLLFTSFWYDHQIVPAQDFTNYTEDTVLYGPLCMNIDVIRPSIALPSLKRGEHVVVQRIGAYNMTQWLQFITLRPNIVLIDKKGKVHVIRKNETVETIKSQELVPDFLK